jgi:5-methylcytosine-specific restriction endonuclease McrA
MRRTSWLRLRSDIEARVEDLESGRVKVLQLYNGGSSDEDWSRKHLAILHKQSRRTGSLKQTPRTNRFRRPRISLSTAERASDGGRSASGTWEGKKIIPHDLQPELFDGARVRREFERSPSAFLASRSRRRVPWPLAPHSGTRRAERRLLRVEESLSGATARGMTSDIPDASGEADHLKYIDACPAPNAGENFQSASG